MISEMFCRAFVGYLSKGLRRVSQRCFFSFLKYFVSIEGFQVVVIGIDEGDVYLRVCRTAADRVHQDEVSVCADRSRIGGSRERGDDLIGRIGIFRIAVQGKLVEPGGENGSGPDASRSSFGMFGASKSQ